MKKPFSISRSIRMVPLLFVILFAGATLTNSKRCPPINRISPCVCDGDPDIKRVVCSNITSEEHLKDLLGRLSSTEIPRLVLRNLSFSTLPHLGGPDLRVRDLEILDGNISYIPPTAFQAQPLYSLRVDRNNLTYVPSAITMVQWYLKILSLSGNFLTELEYLSPLHGMNGIEKLTLSENDISEVARHSLPRYVQYLWISRNKLTTFNEGLHYTKELRHLDASYNNLRTMKRVFHGFLYLQTVILDHNNISDISDTFSHLDSLQELSLVGNGILEVGEALADLRNLTHLNLSRNGITNLNRKVFENMIHLYDLNLSENPLTAFQICPTLKPLKSLRIINFSNSNLDGLHSDCFEKNTNLGFVDLSRSNISNLELIYVTNLVTLDISFNNFEYLWFLVLPKNGSSTTLILEGNPWRCSKILMIGMRYLHGNGYYFPKRFPQCIQYAVKSKRCRRDNN